MMVRGRRMLGAVARFSKLADHSERGAGFDSAAVLDQDLRQHASDGRPDFTSDVVGINLDQWFSESDGISGALEPPVRSTTWAQRLQWLAHVSQSTWN